MRTLMIPRDRLLFAPDDGQGSGAPGTSGNATPPAKVEFSPEQHAHVDNIIKERLGREAAKYKPLESKVAEYETKLREVEEQRQAEAAQRQQAEEAARLEKMSVDDKLKHYQTQHSEELKRRESKYAQDIAAKEQLAARVSEEFTSYVKRGQVMAAVVPGAAEGLSEYAVDAFLRDSQVELNETREVSEVVVKGKRFTDMASAAKYWFELTPAFAKAPAGGAGGPRRGGAGFNGQTGDRPAVDLISLGLAGRGR